jgi:hypothetical protein
LFAGEIQAHEFHLRTQRNTPTIRAIREIRAKNIRHFPARSPTSAIWFSIVYFYRGGMSTCNVLLLDYPAKLRMIILSINGLID